MSLIQITTAEINNAKVASLPTRPNAPMANGGAGLSSAEFRAKLDALALLAINKLNALIALLKAAPDSEDGSLIGEIDTGIENGDSTYTLAELIETIGTGDFAPLLKVLVGEDLVSLDVLLSEKAPLASPTFTGTPTASIAGDTDNSGRIATTAWVRTFISAISTLFDKIQDGTYGGFVPIGGSTNEVLAKSSDATHALKWQSLADYAFGSPTATTPTAGDNTTLLATTAFVKAAIDALKAGATSAYDTLREIEIALAGNDGLSGALAEIASKDNKTEFSDFATGGTLVLESHHEYRALDTIIALTLTFPSSPANDFICTIDFSTDDENDMSYSYIPSPTVYSTGDDCIKEGELEGTFMPIRGKHYTWTLWYAGGKYQGVVRRSA